MSSTMATVFAGGLLRWLLDRGAADEKTRLRQGEQGVLFGSGLVGGEGVLGVFVAGVVFWQSLRVEPGADVRMPLEVGHGWLQAAAESLGITGIAAEAVPQMAAVLVFFALATVFSRCCRTR